MTVEKTNGLRKKCVSFIQDLLLFTWIVFTQLTNGSSSYEHGTVVTNQNININKHGKCAK